MSKCFRLLALVLSLLGTGCTGLPTGRSGGPAPVTEPGGEPGQITRLQSQARMLRYSGRYAESLERLDAALALHPDQEALRSERTQTEADWRRLEQELRDYLLTIDAESVRERVPVLERLVRADPDNPALRDELIGLNTTLREQTGLLEACCARQMTATPTLAGTWRRLAEADHGPADSGLAQPPGRRTAARSPEAAEDAKDAKDAASPDPGPPQLTKARELIKAGNQFGAIRYLEKIAEEGVGTDEARALLQQAKDELARNTEILLSTGDTLYQEGKVKEALALWQAAMSINPFDATARRKSERAMRVLANMRALRDAKPSASPGSAL